MAVVTLASATDGMLLRMDPTDSRWVEFVHAHPAATVFHHPAWAGLLSDCYGYPTFAAAVLDNAGTILSGVPVAEIKQPFRDRRWVSLPFTDHCPLLTREDLPHALVDTLVQAMKTHRIGKFQLRADLPPQENVYTTATAVRHILPLLGNPNDVAATFSKMHRRNIRRAERAGVKLHYGTTPADIRSFYDLHALTRRRLGIPIQPRRFFDLLCRRVLQRGMGFVLSAHVDQTPVAAAIFLGWNGTLIYKYGASDHRFWSVYANNLLFWSAIRWACENGYHTFDWGRTDLEAHGLRAFKSGWGAQEVPLPYSLIADAPPAVATGPGQLQRVLGTVVRRSPPWVGRVIGELLYRYAA